MSAAQVGAIVAQIAGTGSQALRVYTSRPTNPAYPYVVVYADGGLKWSDREADERVRHTQTWQTTVVGITEDQCRAAADRTHERLENQYLTLDGWTTSKVELEAPEQIRVDESLPDRVVHYIADRWSAVFDPA